VCSWKNINIGVELNARKRCHVYAAPQIYKQECLLDSKQVQQWQLCNWSRIWKLTQQMSAAVLTLQRHDAQSMFDHPFSSRWVLHMQCPSQRDPAKGSFGTLGPPYAQDHRTTKINVNPKGAGPKLGDMCQVNWTKSKVVCWVSRSPYIASGPCQLDEEWKLPVLSHNPHIIAMSFPLSKANLDH